MILKKPYKFLIKYFKLINLLFCVLALYIFYRSYNIINFFNEYIVNNYTGNYFEGFSNSYISPFMYLILFVLFILIGGIYLLFRYKKKPTKIYVFCLIYNTIFIFYLIFIKDLMVTLETTVITAETARLYRDISVIAILPQLPLIISFLLRGFGFNIKKFNFEQDLKELEIEDNDDEEVEIVLKKDSVKLQRNINRFIREFKYYVKENKFIFSVICIVLLIALGFFVYKSLPEIIDREYNQGESFVINNLTYIIEDSIVTNIDYKGDIINNNYYLVMRISIENQTDNNIELDYNDFRLVLKDRYVYPSMDYGKNFIDYAKDNYNSEIKANSKGIYSIVYEIKEEDLKKHYEIKIANGSALSDNLLIGRHDYITISPIVINKVNVASKLNAGEEINFANSNLGNSKLTLSNPIITDKYIYDYEHCINGTCGIYKDMININYTVNNSILMVLDYNYEIDNSVPFYSTSSNINTFIKSFVKVKYIGEDKKTKYAEIKNVTPSKLKNKIVIETTNKIQKSDEIEVSITIRNKEYLVKVK